MAYPGPDSASPLVGHVMLKPLRPGGRAVSPIEFRLHHIGHAALRDNASGLRLVLGGNRLGERWMLNGHEGNGHRTDVALNKDTWRYSDVTGL